MSFSIGHVSALSRPGMVLALLELQFAAPTCTGACGPTTPNNLQPTNLACFPGHASRVAVVGVGVGKWLSQQSVAHSGRPEMTNDAEAWKSMQGVSIIVDGAMQMNIL